MKRSAFLILGSAILITFTGCSASGPNTPEMDSKGMMENPEMRPVFLRALEDLHRARNYISRANPHQEEIEALMHIDVAIHALKTASFYNSDDYNLHPTTDATLDNYDRYRIGVGILNNVLEYLKPNVPDRFSQKYQDRAVDNIQDARDLVNDMINQRT